MAQLESTGPNQQIRQGALPLSASATRRGLSGRDWASRAATIVALIIGGVLAYTLPAVTVQGGGNHGISEVTDAFTRQGTGWVLTLSWFSAVLAIISAVVFPRSERFIQAVAISAGAIVAMAFPYYVATHLTAMDPKADSLGSGMVGAWVAFAVAAAIPWLSLVWWNRATPVLERDWAKWLFLLPAIIWILLLTVFPLIYEITISRYQYRNGRLFRFVGWNNYKRLFDAATPWKTIGIGILIALIVCAIVLGIGLALRWRTNREIRQSDVRSLLPILPIFAVPAAVVYLAEPLLKDPLGTQLNYTFFFVFFSVAVEMILGFLVALFMNREMRGRGVLRAIITLPIFATPIALGYLFRTIFYEKGGPANALLGNFGFSPPWLSDPLWSRISTVIVDVWQWTPFVFIIALAGLQSLPQDIVEASEVDGANAWQNLRFIIMPMMAPILWLILLLRMIDGFKVFDIPSGLTLGGPGRATEYFSLFNYRTARKFFNYGDAAAEAFLLLFIVMLLVSLLWSRISHIYDVEGVRNER
jgi:multiple sugar transport system permease protein